MLSRFLGCHDSLAPRRIACFNVLRSPKRSRKPPPPLSPGAWARETTHVGSDHRLGIGRATWLYAPREIAEESAGARRGQLRPSSPIAAATPSIRGGRLAEAWASYVEGEVGQRRRHQSRRATAAAHCIPKDLEDGAIWNLAATTRHRRRQSKRRPCWYAKEVKG